MQNRTELLKGIRDEDERIFCARGLDRADVAARTYVPKFSDFADPYKTALLLDMVHKQYGYELNVISWGGTEDAERRMTGFFPEYTEADTKEFPIACVEIRHNPKFSRELTHRDYLGSVLGLGITREKTGDILIQDGCAYIFAEKEVAEYIAANLEYVGHTKVKTALSDSYRGESPRGFEKRITVSSLRLDAVLSSAFNLSRGKVSDLIKGGKAFINWIPSDNVSKSVAPGDMLTLRGIGRVRLIETGGMTKRDRHSLTVEIFK